MSSQLTAVILPAFIPSPSQGVWHLFGLPLRAYALCILAGIFVGYWLGRKRWVSRGGSAEVLADIIMWAVPFGLVGARIYHVVTDWSRYFGKDGDPVEALKIWHGGLGIWGAIAFGALGAWIACRRHKVPFLAVADAMAPGIALAQVLGRFGNYWNQELYGRPTTHWFGLEIDPQHRVAGFEQYATFHPTFLYEALWNLGVVALVLLAGRRFKLGHGRAFALYVAGYTVGRAWIENLRIDTADHVLGLRLNVWTSLIVFAAAVVFFILSARRHPGQEDLRTATPEDDDTPSAADQVADASENADEPASGASLVDTGDESTPESERPEGAGAPAGDRPVGASVPAGDRPTGASVADAGRPADASVPADGRPAGASVPTNGRPAGAGVPAGDRPAGASTPAGDTTPTAPADGPRD
ncbi:prolipoprotein diacylglyceryl transferase [Kribbella sp. DT2]|uniref:prolipoprotein diacylglyceryl transferase n=1 Tax=Kribbella sp. DT2 TaxID=3393427 RepID=UPI003CFADB11